MSAEIQTTASPQDTKLHTDDYNNNNQVWILVFEHKKTLILDLLVLVGRARRLS